MEYFSEFCSKLAKDAATNDLVMLVLHDVALTGRVSDPFHHVLSAHLWELLGQNHRQLNESNVSEDSSKIEFS